MSFETTTPSKGPVAIPSLAANGAAYLCIVPERNGRVRVERTNLGKRKLNAFWPVWLRQLILQKSDLHDMFSVELRDDDVQISSNVTSDGLVMTVMHLASQIVPIPEPPIVRSYVHKFEMTWWPTANKCKYWEELPDGAALEKRLRELQLPPHVKLSFDGVTIQLQRGKRCQVKMRHLAHMVELNVALHYGQSYQQFPTPHHPHQ